MMNRRQNREREKGDGRESNDERKAQADEE
jgi:hypothetical protein